MVVVDAVDDEVHAATEGVVWLPVEDQPVQPVLGQGPEADAAEAEQHQLPGGEALVGAQPPHRDDDRTEDQGRGRWMHPGEEVEEFALEKLRGSCQPVGSIACRHPWAMVAREEVAFARRGEVVTGLCQRGGSLRKGGSRECDDSANMRRHAAQAKAALLRGLLLPQEPALCARAGGALLDVSCRPPRGSGAAAAAGAADETSPLGVSGKRRLTLRGGIVMVFAHA